MGRVVARVNAGIEARLLLSVLFHLLVHVIQDDLCLFKQWSSSEGSDCCSSEYDIQNSKNNDGEKGKRPEFLFHYND